MKKKKNSKAKHEIVKSRVKVHHEMAWQHCLKDAKKRAKSQSQVHHLARKYMKERAVPIIIKDGRIYIGL